jgi:hypothetical protein
MDVDKSDPSDVSSLPQAAAFEEPLFDALVDC